MELEAFEQQQPRRMEVAAAGKLLDSSPIPSSSSTSSSSLFPPVLAQSRQEFELEMEAGVNGVVWECIAHVGGDPREYHPYYLTVHHFILFGLQHGYIPVDRAEGTWQKCDQTAATQYNARNNDKSEKSNVGGPGPESPYLSRILRQGGKGKVPKSLENKFEVALAACKKLQEKANVGGGGDSLGFKRSLSGRLEFFEHFKSVTSPNHVVAMNSLWTKYLSGGGGSEGGGASEALRSTHLSAKAHIPNPPKVEVKLSPPEVVQATTSEPIILHQSPRNIVIIKRKREDASKLTRMGGGGGGGEGFLSPGGGGGQVVKRVKAAIEQMQHQPLNLREVLSKRETELSALRPQPESIQATTSQSAPQWDRKWDTSAVSGQQEEAKPFVVFKAESKNKRRRVQRTNKAFEQSQEEEEDAESVSEEEEAREPKGRRRRRTRVPPKPTTDNNAAPPSRKKSYPQSDINKRSGGKERSNKNIRDSPLPTTGSKKVTPPPPPPFVARSPSQERKRQLHNERRRVRRANETPEEVETRRAKAREWRRLRNEQQLQEGQGVGGPPNRAYLERRKERLAALSPEEKSQRAINSYMARAAYCARLGQTPTEYASQLSRAWFSKLGGERQEAVREGMRRTARRQYERMRQNPEHYERVKAYQRERRAKETPEQRQKRLMRLKIGQARAKLRREMEAEAGDGEDFDEEEFEERLAEVVRRIESTPICSVYKARRAKSSSKVVCTTTTATSTTTESSAPTPMSDENEDDDESESSAADDDHDDTAAVFPFEKSEDDDDDSGGGEEVEGPEEMEVFQVQEVVGSSATLEAGGGRESSEPEVVAAEVDDDDESGSVVELVKITDPEEVEEEETAEIIETGSEMVEVEGVEEVIQAERDEVAEEIIENKEEEVARPAEVIMDADEGGPEETVQLFQAAGQDGEEMLTGPVIQVFPVDANNEPTGQPIYLQVVDIPQPEILSQLLQEEGLIELLLQPEEEMDDDEVEDESPVIQQPPHQPDHHSPQGPSTPTVKAENENDDDDNCEIVTIDISGDDDEYDDTTAAALGSPPMSVTHPNTTTLKTPADLGSPLESSRQEKSIDADPDDDEEEEEEECLEGTGDHRVHQCEVCHRSCPSETQLRVHLQRSHPSQCWKCPECQQVMLSPAELADHFKAVHEQENNKEGEEEEEGDNNVGGSRPSGQHHHHEKLRRGQPSFKTRGKLKLLR